jgi:hypothetical protein
MQTGEQAFIATIYQLKAKIEEDLDTRGQREAFGERVIKALNLVLAGAVSGSRETGIYQVQGSGKEPYTVNGACQCQDFQGGAAPEGICKHRLAVWMTRKGEEVVKAQRHTHAYTCCGAEGEVLCYQAGCDEKEPVVCARCQEREEKEVEGVAHPEVSDVLETLADDDLQGRHQAQEEARALREELAPLEDEVSPLNYRACLDEQMYERYIPEPAHGEPEMYGPLPEAPASVYLKLKLPGGHEMSWTMRSMREGSQGDEEILARLPMVIEGLQKLAERSQTRGRWLQKLATLFQWTRED